MFQVGPVVLVHTVHGAVEVPVEEVGDNVGIVLGHPSFGCVEDCGLDPSLPNLPHHASSISHHTEEREREGSSVK